MELPENYSVLKTSINSFPGYVGFNNKRDDTAKKEHVSLEELFKNIMEASKQKNKENPLVNTVYIDPSAKSTITKDDYCVEDQFDALEQQLLATANSLLGKVKGNNTDVELVSMIVGLVNAINVLQEAKERAGII